MRVAFLGSPDFACPALRATLESGHDVSLVVSQPDRPRGRGGRVSPTPLRQLALDLGLPTAVLGQDGRTAVYRSILQLGPDIILVVAFGHLIREPLLNGARLGCLNVHASLLPRWRGAAPIHRAVMAGDRETGVTTMRLEAGLDTGPIYLQDATAIGPLETAGRLHDRLAEMGGALLARTLERLAKGTLRARPQPTEGVCYAPRLEREEGSVDFEQSSRVVHDRIRGLDPWPGVTVLLGDRRLKLRASRPGRGGRVGRPGQVVAFADGAMEIACGQGSIWVERLQPAGGRAMSPVEYALGHDLAVGTCLLGLSTSTTDPPASGPTLSR